MRRPSICVLGAAADTGNLGVSALLESILAGCAGVRPDAHLTVFDNGFGLRSGTLEFADRTVGYDRRGIRWSRRIHRPESLANMFISARFRGIGNAGVRAIRESTLVMDISGGDSFTDLYGQDRFEMMAQQKDLVLRCGVPLVLLPQTYGPFASTTNERRAAELVRRSSMAWARDPDSYAVLVELLGSDHDPQRHRMGVDAAFALPSTPPPNLDPTIGRWLDDDHPVLGLNVSGLLLNDASSSERFGFAEPYRELMTHVVSRLLAETGARLLLVPHVVPMDPKTVESDVIACERVAEALADRYLDRVQIVRGVRQARHAKWIVSRCDAFCGTRMHSTIAALSTGTPVVALAYSPKTRGVFETCGQEAWVADLRTKDADEVADLVLALWADRQELGNRLSSSVPAVVSRALEPYDAMLDTRAIRW